MHDDQYDQVVEQFINFVQKKSPTTSTPSNPLIRTHRSFATINTKPTAKKATGTTQATNSTPSNTKNTPNDSKQKKKVDASAQYQRMSQREHILLRPEPYIGSSECMTERTWVLTKPLAEGEDGQVVDVDFNFIPGLYKIFDEILVNAADNVHRNSNSAKMSYIDIEINPINNHFLIENDGASIPIVLHAKENIYVPELIFGHLLTSSNYDDTEARFTGGRHGFGAKLTNIFSKRFVITIGDNERNLIYRQEFSQNMAEIHPGVIIDTNTGNCTDTKGNVVDINNKTADPSLKTTVKSLLSSRANKNFTRIEFYPDLERFQVDRLTFLPTSGSVQGQSSVQNANSTPQTEAQLEKSRRSLQKKQLSEVLTRNDSQAMLNNTVSSASTDNNFSIILHKSPELNSLLQKDPYACFPPFLLPLFERRVLDVVSLMGNFGVDVNYNKKRLKTNTYAKYLLKCPSFPQPDPNAKKADKKAEKKAPKDGGEEDDDLIDEEDQDKLTGSVVTTWLDKHWFVGVSQRPQFHNTNSGSQSLNQLSFVNSVATTRGGSHVQYVNDIIARYIVNYLNQPSKKKKWGIEQDINIGLVKQFMCVFVSCYITNPSFDTQTKDTLTTHIKGPQTIHPSKSANVTAPALSESFLKQICAQTGIIQNLILSLQQRQHKQLQRKLDAPGRRVPRSGGLAIEKLDDALWAGTDRGSECTLILTEGDSAKALAVSGLSVLGRERFGVYPLKGKLLNVRDASKLSISNNKELVEIMQILGLKMTGNDRSHLRYGSVLVMADQDHDGSHIKGLLMNALHVLCPDLVKAQIHEVSEYPAQNEDGSHQPREIGASTKEVIDQVYERNLPENLKLNTVEHQFVRLFVTPIVKATFVGTDFPILTLQRNLNYQQDLIDFQSKYGHLTPKQIDQLNATRKMLHQSRRDGEHAIEGDATQLQRQKKMKKGQDDDVVDLEVISVPEQYNTSLTFDKKPQQDEHHHHHGSQQPHHKGKGGDKPPHKDDIPIKRINDAITVRGKVISFYSQFAYRQWWEKLAPSMQKKFRCKYYKGLGTSTSAEGKEYFSDLPSHIIDLLHRSRHDDQSLNLAFAKDAVEHRKLWVVDNSHIPPSDEYIRSYNKRGAYKNPSVTGKNPAHTDGHQIQSKYLASRYTTINEFIHNELVQFSVADTIRSLPSTLDGFKPSQRKITYAALTKPLNSELRVSQFAAFVAERLVYHHGEQSLTAAIVNLAQDYPGTNNIPLLTGVGQFGTRHTGGKDHASARYIYTKTGPLTHELFPSADFQVLPQQTEEGTVIEPIHLLPILPMMIINGSNGIGTGFSTDIPAHNPLHVFQAVIQWLNNKPMRLIAPFSIGLTSQLYPQSFHPFNQSHHSAGIKTINNVDLSQEVQLPDIDAPWEVIPLVDTTDGTKKYPFDLSYGINEVVQHGILRKSPTNVYSSDHLVTEMVQFTIDNRPILNSNARQVQSKVKQHRLKNPTYTDEDFSQFDHDKLDNSGLFKGSTASRLRKLRGGDDGDVDGDVDGNGDENSTGVDAGDADELNESNDSDFTDELLSELALSDSSEGYSSSEEPSSEEKSGDYEDSVAGGKGAPQSANGNEAKHSSSPLDKIKQLQSKLSQLQDQTASQSPSKPKHDPNLTSTKTTSHTMNTQQQKQPQKQASPLLDLSYLDRTDVAITKWTSHGKYFLDAVSKRTFHIVELPHGVTTASYKKFLIAQLSSNNADASPNDIVIDRIEERHTEQHVWFTVHCQLASIHGLAHEELMQKLRLTSNVSLTNMHGFGADNNLNGFADVRIPLAEYCVERLKCYERRRAVQITEKWRQLRLSSNISKFCSMIMSGQLSLTNKSKSDLLLELHRLGFDKYSQIYPKDNVMGGLTPLEVDLDGENKGKDGVNTSSVQTKSKSQRLRQAISQASINQNPLDMMNHLSDFEDEEEGGVGNIAMGKHDMDASFVPDNGYDYLLKIPILSATKEKVKQLGKQMTTLQSQVASLVHTTARQMWLHELSILQPKLENYVKTRHEQAFKHPFIHHPGYKAAVDGTTSLPFDVTGSVARSKAEAAAASAEAAKATKTKRTIKPTGAKKVTNATKAKKATTTKTKKTTAKKTTAKKTTTRSKKTTGATANEDVVIDYTPFPSIMNGQPKQNISLRPVKPDIIPSVYNDDFVVPNRY
jgi:DNA gyrase/topoisomerase IV subunit B